MTNHILPIRILFADDDIDDRDFFQYALKKASDNTTLTTVEDGEKLINYLVSIDGKHPDLIFLDINMPCKNGKQCLKEIRMMEELKDVPVIMFSTSTHPEDIEETFANGANLYVPKPISIQDEVKIITNILSLYQQKQLLKPDKKRFVIDVSKLQ